MQNAWHGGKDKGVPLSMAQTLVDEVKHIHFKSLNDEGHLTLVFAVMYEVISVIKNNTR
jgi:hypothetical protein